MAQYRNRDWYVGRFKGDPNNPGKCPKSKDEAYEMIVKNLKRPGYKDEHICAKNAYLEVYKEPFMSPEDRRRLELNNEIAELEKKKAELAKPIAVVEQNISEIVVEQPIELTKAEFKEKFCKDMGYGSEVTLNNVDRLKFGKLWKAYPFKKEE